VGGLYLFVTGDGAATDLNAVVGYSSIAVRALLLLLLLLLLYLFVDGRQG
jgi:hypothetical protein